VFVEKVLQGCGEVQAVVRDNGVNPFLKGACLLDEVDASTDLCIGVIVVCPHSFISQAQTQFQRQQQRLRLPEFVRGLCCSQQLFGRLHMFGVACGSGHSPSLQEGMALSFGFLTQI